MSNITFEMKIDLDIEEAIREQRSSVSTVVDTVKRLQDELRHCRNELCFQCGKHVNSHEGACNGCRYKLGGEWCKDLDS